MNKHLGYKAAFYAHALISIPTLLIMKSFTPKTEQKEVPKFGQGIRILLKNWDALIFFLFGQSVSQCIICLLGP